MKIVTYNVNGVRAALKKGLLTWLESTAPDVLCLQEVKASRDQVDMSLFQALGYRHICWFAAEKKGYSGVAILSRVAPECTKLGCGIELYDNEGRIVSFDFPDFTLINVYFPSGSSGDVRQAVKMQWLDDFYDYISNQYPQKRNLVICGDLNICHKPIDIHNPAANKNSSGFLPEEREWLTKFLDLGFIDTFRYFNQEAEQYTWWSNFFNARKNNKGWRLDYLLASTAMEDKLQRCVILKDAVHSDHCPVLLELDYAYEISKAQRQGQLSIFDM